MRVTKISSFYIVEHKGYRISVKRQAGRWVATYQNNLVVAKTKKKAIEGVIKARLQTA